MLTYPPLFKIGLAPLAPEKWLTIDERLLHYLEEKDRRFEDAPDEVFMALPETDEAQEEILGRVLTYIESQYGALYEHQKGGVLIQNVRHVPLDDGVPPLLQAARLIQDDLLLMRKTESGWILAAGALFFPSSWRLSEKFKRPMHEIHAPVPGFSEGTRNALLIERIFDNLKPSEPLRRENWGLYADDNLVHEKKRAKHADRFDDPVFLTDPFVRSEVQTLTKLPRSGDILFTVRIDVARLSIVRSRPGGAEATAHLSRNLAAMEPEQLRYKGLDKARNELLLHLQRSG